MDTNKPYTIDDVKKEYDRLQFKMKAIETWNSVKNFVLDNKEILLFAGTGIAAGAKVVGKMIGSTRRIKNQQDLKDLYVWDPSLGMQVPLKRKMSSTEMEIFAKRRHDGEKCWEIIKSMNLLK